ncbi:hypothetical protein [Streptomyces sp. NPDC058953]|uniref:hypothetical protein n=1 Tax=unclassified Streptomyces TaxID=2593676 RepID=UPI00367F05E1
MRDLILRTLERVLRLVVPAHGRHRHTGSRRRGTHRDIRRRAPLVICAPARPVHAHTLRRTMPAPGRTFRVPPYMEEAAV